MKKKIIIILLVIWAQIASAQVPFDFPDTLTMTHVCEEGTFVDIQLYSGQLSFTFPNSHELYILGSYDEDPIWDPKGQYYYSCFSGGNFHGYYVIHEEEAWIRLVLNNHGVVLSYGKRDPFVPACFNE